MALPNGELQITPLNPQHAYPVDKRMQADTLNSRDSISPYIRWRGMQVHVLENDTTYMLKGGVTNEFWTVLGEGSGGGGSTFVGQFATVDLLPATSSSGDYAYVGDSENFLQYNWDNIAGKWVSNATNLSPEKFYTSMVANGPVLEKVVFTKTLKDEVIETDGAQVIYPAEMKNFIFTGSGVVLEGVGYTDEENEFSVENRTDGTLSIITNGGVANAEFAVATTIPVGGKKAFKGNGTTWDEVAVNEIAFSDSLNSSNAEFSTDRDGLELITNVFDNETGEEVVFKEYSSTPEILDGVVFIQVGAKYFKRAGLRSLNYSIFGVVGDGLNDDAVQIKIAHQIANILDLPIINEDGEYWLKNPNNIPIRTNVNWGKTVFHIDESKHSNVNKWFIIERSEEPTDVVLDAAQKASFLSKLKEGVSQISELATYKNKYLIVRDDNDLKGRNGGSGIGEPKLEVFKVAEKGKIIGDILAQFTDYTFFKSYKIEKNYLTVDGGSFLFNNMDNPAMAGLYIYSGFDIKRTKVIFRNQDLSIEGGSEPIVMSFSDIGFYYFSESCDVYLENITLLPRRVTSSGTYGIGVRYCMDVHLKNITSEADDQYWGTMEGVHVKNLHVNYCKLNRVDCHDNLINATIQNCDLSLISVVGGGLLKINNTKVNNQSLVVFRADYGSVWDGDIDVENCRQVFSSTPASVVGILSFYPDPQFDYKRKIIFGRTININNVSIIYSTENTIQHLVMRLPSRGQNTTTGYRFYLPTQINCSNIDVTGRGLGIILMQLDVPADWRTEKESDFTNGVIKPNSFLSFRNVDSDVNKTTQESIIFGSAFSIVDSNTFIPQIDVDNCQEVSLQFRDSILKANVRKTIIGSVRTVTTGWRGYAVFEDCLVKPRGRMIVDLEDNHITWLNCQFDIPFVLDSDVEITTISEWNSRYEFNMTLNSYLAGSHINSIFTDNATLFFSSLATVIIPDFSDRMFLSNGENSPYINRRYGTTAQRPPSDRINTNYLYFDTTIDAPIVWDGDEWRNYNAPDATETVKGIAEFATQTEVNSGVNDLTIVTPKKLADSNRIVKMHGANLTTLDGSTLTGQLITGAITTVFNNNTGTGWPTANGDARTFIGPAFERTWTLYKDRDTFDLYVQSYNSTGVGLGWVNINSFIGSSDTPSTYAGNATKIPSVNSGETALEWVDIPVGIVAKGVSITGAGFYTPTTADNYLTPVEIFRNSPFSWLAEYYEVGRIVEVNLSGTCNIPATQNATFYLNIGGTRYCPIEIDGAYNDNWSIRYLITIRATTAIRLAGNINGKNISDVNTTNETVDFSINQDITIDVGFSSNDASNSVSSNLIYVNVI